MKKSIFQYVPNALTISRMFLAIIFPFVKVEYQFTIVIISILTEFLDGALSKAFNWTTKLGALLDPIADKMFIFSVLLTIFFQSDLTWWQFFFIGSRDITVFLGASFLLLIEKNWRIFTNVRPRLLGKSATALQFILILNYLYIGHFNKWLLYSTVTISIIAGIDYLYLLFQKNFYRKLD